MKKLFSMCLALIVISVTIVNAQDGDPAAGQDTLPRPDNAPHSMTLTDLDNLPVHANDPAVNTMPYEPIPAGQEIQYQAIQHHGHRRHIKALMQWSHWGYADRFHEPPLGASLDAVNRAQIGNAIAASLILYHYDFCEDLGTGQPSLSERGLRRLRVLAARQACMPGAVLVVQRIPGQPQLSSARRELVATVLQQSGVSIPVVVGEPMVPGMHGTEAIEVHKKMMRQVGSMIGGGN